MTKLPPPKITHSLRPPSRKKALANDGFLFFLEEDWTKLWKGMPEYKCEDLSPFKTLLVHFTNYSDIKKFAKLIGQTITPETRSLWFPKAEIDKVAHLRYISADHNTSQRRYFEFNKEDGVVITNVLRELPLEIEATVLAFDDLMHMLV